MPSDGRWACRIVFASLPPEETNNLIRRELDAAVSGGYSLEWKYYGHDTPIDLPERLVAARFEAEDEEEVFVLPLDEASLAAFGDGGEHEIRIVREERDLVDYAEVSREIGRHNVEEERRALALKLKENSDEMSIHIAYVDGEPVACGRGLLPARRALRRTSRRSYQDHTPETGTVHRAGRLAVAGSP
ncbi:hypothetical protein SAMN06295926_1091 [Lysinibacillus sp. AC-3]|nr:hypothetical protein SAMN06295926_1091 [Lysinibacillus sp. AC-3]